MSPECHEDEVATHFCAGGKRGLGLNEERDQTLNQLLTELDGFEVRQQASGFETLAIDICWVSFWCCNRLQRQLHQGLIRQGRPLCSAAPAHFLRSCTFDSGRHPRIHFSWSLSHELPKPFSRSAPGPHRGAPAGGHQSAGGSGSRADASRPPLPSGAPSGF